MQLNIGILEDDSAFAEELSSHIHLWEKQNYCKVEIYTFGTCEAFEKSEIMLFDLIFLDIQLPDGNGLELAKTIRTNGYTGELIFLTSYQEYVFEGYHVRAMDYLLKPTRYEVIENCLNTIFSMFNDENYIYRYKDTIIKIPYHSIICFTSSNHTTEIVTISGTFTQRESLRNILKYLPSQFEQCHRTVVINMQHVMQITTKDITLSNNMVIHASKTFIENIRAAFIAQIQK